MGFKFFRYAVEMHLVHRNRRYNDLNEAKKHRDGLVVLGVFFQVNKIKLCIMTISIKQLDIISIISFRIGLRAEQFENF